MSSRFLVCILLVMAMNNLNAKNYPDDYNEVYLEAKNARSIDGLSVRDRTGFCMYILEMEVNNGGFHQFFYNSSGRFALQSVEALENIGASKTASLLSKAISIAYPRGYPRDSSLHQSLLLDFDTVSDELYELDIEFYRYEDDLARLTNEYLQKGT